MVAGGGVEWLVKSLVEGIPVLVALGAGCALSLLGLRRHPRPAGLALGGGLVLLLHFVAGRLWGAFGVARLYAGGAPAPFALAGANLLLNLLLATGLGLLFYAAFAGREA